jgi:cysteine desulfuration protein SufE
MNPIEQAQAEIIKRFNFFPSWEEKYQYLIQMGRKLKNFPPEWEVEANLIPGCQSQVWLVTEEKEGRLYFHAKADSVIVSGLIALLVQVFSGATREEIQGASLDFIKDIGLNQHLSPTRSNGLHAMLTSIRAA